VIAPGGRGSPGAGGGVFSCCAYDVDPASNNTQLKIRNRFIRQSPEDKRTLRKAN
jgi:hypothetical protein